MKRITRKGEQIMDKIFENYDDILEVEQAAEALHTSKASIYKLLRNNDLKSVKIGRIYKIPKKFLIEYLEEKLIA